MSRAEKYSFPAVLGWDAPTERYYVLWPDLPGCTTTGGTERETIENARDAMLLHLSGMREDGEAIPEPTLPGDLDLSEYEEDGNTFTLISVEVWVPLSGL